MSDYTDILQRLRAALVDVAGVIWGTDELDEALRQALADLGQAGGVAYAVAGLDGAAATTLPAAQCEALVRGAVAYALLWRAAERVDAFNYQAGLPGDALAAAAAVMRRFEAALAGLAAQRTSAMHTAEAAPYPDGTDETQPGWKLADDLANEEEQVL